MTPYSSDTAPSLTTFRSPALPARQAGAEMMRTNITRSVAQAACSTCWGDVNVHLHANIDVTPNATWPA